MATDQELRQTIVQILERDSRIDTNEIQIKVEENVVFINGTVDSAAERNAIVNDVLTIPGVRSVVDYIKLQNYIERSDEELVEAVRQDLIRDPYVDPSNIEVRANNGEIKLEGYVKTYAEKHAAENVALWTPGVANLSSDLEVEEEEESEEPVW